MKKVRGQSIFEVVLAVGIVTVVLVGLIALIAIVLRNTNAARTRAEAAKMLLEAHEWVRNERDTDWGNFYSRTGTSNWCLQTLAWNNSGSCGTNEYVTDKPFRRQVTFQRITPDREVKSTVTINWTDSQGDHTVESETLLTNWRAVQ